jgi:spartin
MPQDGSNQISVAPASQEYLEMALHPAYKNSKLVGRAAAASRLIVTTSSFITDTLNKQAEGFTRSTAPASTPMTFKPTTYARVRKLNTFTGSAAGLSAKAVGQVTRIAQNVGAGMRGKQKEKGENYKPGLLNKSFMAFSTIADGIDQAGRGILAGTSQAATTVVGHRYGDEAGLLTKEIGGGVKNVGLVYIDATGVSRRAIIKSVAKGMVVGKVKGGGDLVVGGGDGGVVDAPLTSSHSSSSSDLRYQDKKKIQASGGRGELVEDTGTQPQLLGFGTNTGEPPAYGSGVGERIEGQEVVPEKYR